MIDRYTFGIDRPLFKVTLLVPDAWSVDIGGCQALRKCLPGPYTFVMKATTEVPKVLLDNKSHKKMWKRREVGIRLPDDSLCQFLVNELEEPLLVSRYQVIRPHTCTTAATLTYAHTYISCPSPLA